MPQRFYVDRGGEQVYRPPFSAKNVDFYGFLIEVDPAKVQKSVCDLAFNDPSGNSEDFVLALPYAVVVFNNLPDLVAIDPPWNERGHFPEHEAALWVLMLDKNRQRLFWTQPYILVDIAFALTMGREIYGFPKGLGWMNIPQDTSQPNLFEVETVVVPQFGPNAKGEKKTLMKVTRDVTSAAGHLEEAGYEAVESFDAFFSTMADVVFKDASLSDLFALARNEFQDMWAHNVEMAFLKQFRAVDNPALAAYQAITSLDCKMDGFHGAKIYTDDFTVEIEDFDSHPVRSDLGIAGPSVKPLVSFWAGFDFWIGPGSTLWQGDATE